MWTVFGFIVVAFIIASNPTYSAPFLYNPQIISTFLSSASAASSSSQTAGNIADLRPEKQVQDDKDMDDDSFFKDDPVVDTPAQNEAVPSFFQKKIGKILRKIQFITSLSGSNDNNGGGGGGGDDLEDFDVEFNDVGGNDNVTTTAAPPSRLTAGTFAVYLMELVGSIFGLTYGAAAQLTQNTTPKPAPLV